MKNIFQCIWKWVSTLFYPVVALVLYAVLLIPMIAGSDDIEEFISELHEWAFTHILAMMCSVLPIVLIIVLKTDISQYFWHRFIYCLASVISILLALNTWAGVFFIIPLVIGLEMLYAVDKDIPFPDNIIIALSNPIFLIIGLLSDFLRMRHQ